jgi:acyl-CoA thioester hydrolase
MDENPLELSRYPALLTIPVAWGEMDAFAHLNNTVYFRYFESARIAYFRSMEVYETGTPTGVGPILASTSCRFRAPIAYPDTVRVGARVREIGSDRFVMEYAIVSEALGRLAANGEGVIVSYDYSATSKVELPARWRECIVAIEGAAGNTL